MLEKLSIIRGLIPFIFFFINLCLWAIFFILHWIHFLQFGDNINLFVCNLRPCLETSCKLETIIWGKSKFLWTAFYIRIPTFRNVGEIIYILGLFFIFWRHFLCCGYNFQKSLFSILWSLYIFCRYFVIKF